MNFWYPESVDELDLFLLPASARLLLQQVVILFLQFFLLDNRISGFYEISFGVNEHHPRYMSKTVPAELTIPLGSGDVEPHEIYLSRIHCLELINDGLLLLAGWSGIPVEQDNLRFT